MVATATIGTWAIQAEDAPAQIARLITSALLGEGVVDKAGDSFKVAQDTGSNMQIKVGSGTVGDLCVVAGDAIADQGVYVGQHQNATQTLAVAASDPSDNRIDRVIARVYDDDADSSGNSYMDLEVLTGTPAGSPSAPATPDGAISLATIEVDAAVTAIVDADITDTRSEASVREASLMDSLPVVRNRVSSASLQDFGTTEGIHVTITLEIPADWNTYDVDIWCSGRSNMNGATGAADLSLRVRRDNAAGSIVHLAVEELSDASDETNETFSLVAFETGRTTTGTITYVLTGQLSAQNTNFRAADKKMVAYAWRTS